MWPGRCAGQLPVGGEGSVSGAPAVPLGGAEGRPPARVVRANSPASGAHCLLCVHRVLGQPPPSCT